MNSPSIATRTAALGTAEHVKQLRDRGLPERLSTADAFSMALQVGQIINSSQRRGLAANQLIELHEQLMGDADPEKRALGAVVEGFLIGWINTDGT